MQTVQVDFNKTLGAIKPLHGVNNGPLTRVFALNMSPYFKEAGIPYARLHDTEYPYGSGHFVDIPCIFPDFSADPEDPKSYDFILTDQYIKAIQEVGTKVFYRLGVSIEHASKKYHIFPPKDTDKWAKICAGIIRHYNEGWAEGFFYDIVYWEIWNEPENPPMWQGTKEEYFNLYVKTAKYLKGLFPHIKVGGYAGCGFYALTRPHMSDFYKGFVTYFTDFLSCVKENDAPLDFFSWHIYNHDIEELLAHAHHVDKTLKAYGFDKTENILNEWNYLTDYKDPCMFQRMRGTEAAAFVAGVFCALQKSSVTMGNYYDAQPVMRYCGIFDFFGPLKPFYAFKAFNTLYRLGQEVYTASSLQSLYVCGATGEGEGAVLLCNTHTDTVKVMLNVQGFALESGLELEFSVLDDTHNLDLIRREILDGSAPKPMMTLAGNTVGLVRIK